MEYSKPVIDKSFNEIFESWPNQTGEAQSKKAFIVALNSGATIAEIKSGAEAYLIDNIATSAEFIKNLGNFIREDMWKDYAGLEGKLAEKKACAFDLIKAWNKACKPHWIHVSDNDSALPVAITALADKPFRNNWKEALVKAGLIFKYPLSDSDMKAKTVLSFRWFCNTAPAKHTVMKVVDGEYGTGIRERTTTAKPYIFVEEDEQARLKAAEELKKLFPDIEFKRKKEKPTKQNENKEIKTIADEILKSVGVTTKSEMPKDEAKDDGIWFS